MAATLIALAANKSRPASDASVTAAVPMPGSRRGQTSGRHRSRSRCWPSAEFRCAAVLLWDAGLTHPAHVAVAHREARYNQETAGLSEGPVDKAVRGIGVVVVVDGVMGL